MRRNSGDDEIRALERAVAEGKPGAQKKLDVARLRRGEKVVFSVTNNSLASRAVPFHGLTFNVVIEQRTGPGLGYSGLHVQFYDPRYTNSPNWKAYGQPVSGYYIETMLDPQYTRAGVGLDLYGGERDWKLDGPAHDEVKERIGGLAGYKGPIAKGPGGQPEGLRNPGFKDKRHNTDEDLRRETRDLDRQDPHAIMKVLSKALRVHDWDLVYRIRRHAYDRAIHEGGRDVRLEARPWHAVYQAATDAMNDSPDRFKHDETYYARKFGGKDLTLNPDEDIRELERAFEAAPDPAVAKKLVRALERHSLPVPKAIAAVAGDKAELQAYIDELVAAGTTPTNIGRLVSEIIKRRGKKPALWVEVLETMGRDQGMGLRSVEDAKRVASLMHGKGWATVERIDWPEDRVNYFEPQHERNVEAVMAEINRLCDTHGIEGIYSERVSGPGGYWGDHLLLYCNTGDTYTTTVCYDTREDEFFLGDWGTFLETVESKEGEPEPDEDEG